MSAWMETDENQGVLVSSPSPGHQTEDEDEEYLQHWILRLTQQEMDSLETVGFLGIGVYGVVSLVQYQGSLAARKSFRDESSARELLWEARLMLELDGAGGAPRVLALCPAPPMLLMEFVGDKYNKYITGCSVGGFLDSVISISECLAELHAAGIIHNDLKADNVTFSGTLDRPVFHIIDYGLSCRSERVVGPFVSRDPYYHSEEHASHMPRGKDFWVAPEVLGGLPPTPASDVHSLGALVVRALRYCRHGFLLRYVDRLTAWCMQRLASRRPAAAQVADAVRRFRNTLAPEQRDAGLGG